MAAKTTLWEKFHSKVALIPFHTCWEWLGTINEAGYGDLKSNKSERRAHRISWILYKGAIPKGLVICHKCDNRKCVNPNHLFIGTHRDNALDKMSKGRHHRHFKNSCKYGHEYVIGSFRLGSRGERVCRICANEYSNMYYWKKLRKSPLTPK